MLIRDIAVKVSCQKMYNLGQVTRNSNCETFDKISNQDFSKYKGHERQVKTEIVTDRGH